MMMTNGPVVILSYSLAQPIVDPSVKVAEKDKHFSIPEVYSSTSTT